MPLVRRRFLQGLATGALGLGLPYPGRDALASKPGEPAPDIVIVVLDALRAESLPIYGCPRNTAPFFVDLAKRSTVYDRCYSTSSWTKPAVTSLLTGLAPSQHGDNSMSTTLPKNAMTFSRRLGQSGYRTGLFTANLILANEYGARHHFDHTAWVKPSRQNAYHLMDEIGPWLSQSGDQPICSYVHFFQPHAPYDPPKKFLESAYAESERVPPDASYLFDHHRDVLMSPYANGDHGRLPPPATAVLKSRDPLDHLIRYEANVRFADAILSDFFDLWQDRRHGKRTVFLVTADHGECLGEHGLFAAHGRLLVDSLLHVPLVLHDTSEPRTARVSSDVSHLDIGPSILALAGILPSVEALGEVTLKPDTRSHANSNRKRPVFSEFVSKEYGIADGAEPAIALTAGRWRLTYNEACGLGPANLVSVQTGDPNSDTLRARALPEPSTKLRRPTSVTIDALVESLALHATHATYRQPLDFGGFVRIKEGSSGSLTIRFRRPGRQADFAHRYECGPGDTRIEGTLPALVAADPNLDCEEVVCEASWERKSVGRPRPSGWQQLFSFAVQTDRDEAPRPDVILTHLQAEPAICLAGNEVRIESVWRCERTPAALQKFHLRVVAADGRVLAEKSGHFLPTQLPDTKRLASLFSPGFSFDQIFRIYVPGDVAAGHCKIELSGANGGVRTAQLDIMRNSDGALRALSRRELGLPHFSAVARYRLDPGAPDRKQVLRTLQRRFRDEGHFHYLEALDESNPTSRSRLLKSCLDRTPNHLAALLAHKNDSNEFRDKRRLITPVQARDIRFGDTIRMFGFDFHRARRTDERIAYLTVFWELSAPTSIPLMAEIACEGATLSWFLGAGTRPTQQWKMGEAVVETVRMPIPTTAPESDSFSARLCVYPYWDLLHSGLYERPLLRAHSDDGSGWASLGNHRLSALPVVAEDPIVGKRVAPASFQLFDLETDPRERRDVKLDRPQEFAELHGQFLELSDRLIASDPTLEKEEADLSDEKREQLRAIGYIE